MEALVKYTKGNAFVFPGKAVFTWPALLCYVRTNKYLLLQKALSPLLFVRIQSIPALLSGSGILKKAVDYTILLPDVTDSPSEKALFHCYLYRGISELIHQRCKDGLMAFISRQSNTKNIDCIFTPTGCLNRRKANGENFKNCALKEVAAKPFTFSDLQLLTLRQEYGLKPEL